MLYTLAMPETSGGCVVSAKCVFVCGHLLYSFISYRLCGLQDALGGRFIREVLGWQILGTMCLTSTFDWCSGEPHEMDFSGVLRRCLITVDTGLLLFVGKLTWFAMWGTVNRAKNKAR
jgi:hypothetical protein